MVVVVVVVLVVVMGGRVVVVVVEVVVEVVVVEEVLVASSAKGVRSDEVERREKGTLTWANPVGLSEDGGGEGPLKGCLMSKGTETIF